MKTLSFPPNYAFFTIITIINTINMSSRYESPLNVSDDDAPRAPSITPSITLSTSTLPSAFGRIMATSAGNTPASKDALPSTIQLHDTCDRPEPSYNNNYNPFYTPPNDLDPRYSLYENGEPLQDDRPVVVSRLLLKYILVRAVKRPRTAWVWKLGYVLTNILKPSNNRV